MAAGDVHQGRRRDIHGSEWAAGEVKVWDYGKIIHDKGEEWYCCVFDADDPNDFMMGNLSGHTVIEHEDQTITVSPSILIGQRTASVPWHGYLERGVWREV